MRTEIKKQLHTFSQNIGNQISKGEWWMLGGCSAILSILILTRYKVEHTEAYIIVLPLILIMGGIIILGFNSKNCLSGEIQPENIYHKSGIVLWYGGYVYLGILLVRLFLTVSNYAFLTELTGNEFLLFLIVILTALVEEFFFRKAILTFALPLEIHRKRSYGVLFFQSIFWAAFHFQYYDRPIQLMIVFLMGLYYGFLYSYSQNIWKPAILHALTNVIGLIYNFSIYLQ